MPTDTTEMLPVSQIDISQKVYTVRGEKVMLDSDLAEIYGYTVKAMNQQVKRNSERFPEDFMFQLSEQEQNNLRSQFVTANPMSRSRPYAFTEQGVYMLATVLKGDLASSQSIAIMRAFRAMRTYIQQNQYLVTKQEMIALEERQNLRIDSMDDRFQQMQTAIDELRDELLVEENRKEYVFLNNQKFEADMAYEDIYAKATKTIYIIDDYVSRKTLQLLTRKKPGVKVILFTQNTAAENQRLTATEVRDFSREYPVLSVKPNPDCHDRYIVLDYGLPTQTAYLCGASSKDAGNKVCSIIQFENSSMVQGIIAPRLKLADKLL